MRRLWELLTAWAHLALARIRRLDPCPPHRFEQGYAFCVKCGQYREAERQRAMQKRRGESG